MSNPQTQTNKQDQQGQKPQVPGKDSGTDFGQRGQGASNPSDALKGAGNQAIRGSQGQTDDQELGEGDDETSTGNTQNKTSRPGMNSSTQRDQGQQDSKQSGLGKGSCGM